MPQPRPQIRNTELNVKQCLGYGLLIAALLLAGCGSQPTRVDATGAVVGASGPEIVLPGGGVEEARLLAMGLARSKGWTLVEASSNRLLLERSLPRDAPQAQSLSPNGVLSEPKLEVETRLLERRGDVVVGLSAFVTADPGTEQERRIDYTSDYQDELLISLNALANAWLETRNRIASEIPLPPDPDEVIVAEAPIGESMDGGASTPAAVLDSTTTTASATPAAVGPTAQPIQPNESSAPIADPIAATAAASDTSPAQDEGDRNQMLVLDDPARRGLWTFYAEASARERGCTIGERGAVLLSSTTAFELYEVQCDSQQNLLLRCQGGVCREIN
jgi:hypothetical protein